MGAEFLTLDGVVAVELVAVGGVVEAGLELLLVLGVVVALLELLPRCRRRSTAGCGSGRGRGR